MEPLDRSTVWPYDERGEPRDFYYQRFGNPTVAAAEAVLVAAVVCRGEAVAEELRTFRGRTGIVAAPDPAWLLLRGLKTLELRVRRQTETAAFLAQRLRAHPAIETVRYPGLGGVLSFDVADAETARRVETSTQVIVNASSLGGVTTLIESRSRWEGDRVPPGLLRVSAGLEDSATLWVDLEQALG